MQHRVGVLVLIAAAAGCGGGASSSSSGANAGTSSGGTHGATAAVDAGQAQTVAASPSASASDGGFIAPSGPQAAQAAQIYAEGNAAYARGDFAAAATAFRRAHQLYPAPEMAFNVARVYERMGEADEAVRYFEMVLHANPEPAQRTDIERRIAALRAYQQRQREGVAQAPASTDALSEEGRTWFTRGVALYRRRQYQPALLAFEQAQQYMNTPELFFNLAVTYEHLNNFDRAIEFMREYLSARVGTPEEADIQRRIQQLEARRR